MTTMIRKLFNISGLKTCSNKVYIFTAKKVASGGLFLTFVSACIGEDDLDWSCDEDTKPESWEEMLESRGGACWGSVELRYRWWE